jgi:uncharacterized lipoprotein YddW (UPF0748 family)
LHGGEAEKTINTEGEMTSDKTKITGTTNAETTPAGGEQPVGDGYTPVNYEDFKAMWLSQFDMQNIYISGGRQRDEAGFKTCAKQIVKNIKNAGFNTVIVQVRPYADSMYPSEYYPMSSMAVGSYGREADYDPFAIILEAAHAEGLSVQAWINPMRAMLDGEISSVEKKYLIRQWYDDSATRGKYIVNVSGRWYLNPAYEEVRQLIINGAREILEKYEVDGLHMDDYFYPTGIDTSFDSAAYADYKKSGGRASLADWRREQLNKLVSGLWSAVKEHNEDLLFGISPAGTFTKVYENMYADIYEWCGKPGYIDYICPQAYFGFEHETYDYIKVVTTYQSMIKTDKVKLIIGLSFGKAKAGYSGGEDQWAGTGRREWIENRDILVRELEYTKKLTKCTGVAVFCYQYFHEPVTGADVKETADERSLFVPLLKTITWKD